MVDNRISLLIRKVPLEKVGTNEIVTSHDVM